MVPPERVPMPALRSIIKSPPQRQELVNWIRLPGAAAIRPQSFLDACAASLINVMTSVWANIYNPITYFQGNNIGIQLPSCLSQLEKSARTMLQQSALD